MLRLARSGLARGTSKENARDYVAALYGMESWGLVSYHTPGTCRRALENIVFIQPDSKWTYFVRLNMQVSLYCSRLYTRPILRISSILYQLQPEPGPHLLILSPRKYPAEVRLLSQPRRRPPHRRVRTRHPPPLLLPRFRRERRKHSRRLRFGILLEVRMREHLAGRGPSGGVESEERR